jgi:hypothetical protein
MDPPSVRKVSDFSNTRLGIPFLDAKKQHIVLLFTALSEVKASMQVEIMARGPD